MMTMEGVCPFLFLMMVSFFLSFLLKVPSLVTMAKVVAMTTLL